MLIVGPSITSPTTTRNDNKVPRVRRIAYSTCSIHATENEHVVRQALQTEECRAGGFVLASRGDVLPSWPRRGLPEEMDNPGSYLVHMQRAALVSHAHVCLTVQR